LSSGYMELRKWGIKIKFLIHPSCLGNTSFYEENYHYNENGRQISNGNEGRTRRRL